VIELQKNCRNQTPQQVARGEVNKQHLHAAEHAAWSKDLHERLLSPWSRAAARAVLLTCEANLRRYYNPCHEGASHGTDEAPEKRPCVVLAKGQAQTKPMLRDVGWNVLTFLIGRNLGKSQQAAAAREAGPRYSSDSGGDGPPKIATGKRKREACDVQGEAKEDGGAPAGDAMEGDESTTSEGFSSSDDGNSGWGRREMRIIEGVQLLWCSARCWCPRASFATIGRGTCSMHMGWQDTDAATGGNPGMCDGAEPCCLRTVCTVHRQAAAAVVECATEP
jgi:hypothetical protein